MHCKTPGLTALLLTSVYTVPVFAAEWEISLGGYYNAMVGYAESDSGGIGEVRDEEIYINPRITLDNGLTFNTRVDFEDDADTGNNDEPVLQVSGSFGTIVIGEDTGSIANSVVTDGLASGACNTKPGDTSLYFTPSFTGANLGAGYETDLSNRHRGAMATENIGVVLNPALTFDYELSGADYSLGTGYCLDTGRILPTTLGLGLNGSFLEGSDSVNNLQFLNGLGVTSMGGMPGVFINSPTDIQNGSFNVDRDSFGLSFDFLHPIRINADGVREELVATPSGSFWRPINSGPSLGVLSVVGGLRYKMFDQRENVSISADTPAFGVNSAWNADYSTKFDSDSYGAYAGLSTSKSFRGRNNLTNTFRVTGTVGYDFYNIDVTDSVNATGLGGALNFTNSQRHSFDDSLLNATLKASYTLADENKALTLSAGLEYGTTPEIKYHRPDSNLAGPLDPTLDLDQNTSMVFQFGYRASF